MEPMPPLPLDSDGADAASAVELLRIYVDDRSHIDIRTIRTVAAIRSPAKRRDHASTPDKEREAELSYKKEMTKIYRTSVPCLNLLRERGHLIEQSDIEVHALANAYSAYSALLEHSEASLAPYKEAAQSLVHALGEDALHKPVGYLCMAPAPVHLQYASVFTRRALSAVLQHLQASLEGHGDTETERERERERLIRLSHYLTRVLTCPNSQGLGVDVLSPLLSLFNPDVHLHVQTRHNNNTQTDSLTAGASYGVEVLKGLGHSLVDFVTLGGILRGDFIPRHDLRQEHSMSTTHAPSASGANPMRNSQFFDQHPTLHCDILFLDLLLEGMLSLFVDCHTPAKVDVADVAVHTQSSMSNMRGSMVASGTHSSNTLDSGLVLECMRIATYLFNLDPLLVTQNLISIYSSKPEECLSFVRALIANDLVSLDALCQSVVSTLTLAKPATPYASAYTNVSATFVSTMLLSNRDHLSRGLMLHFLADVLPGTGHALPRCVSDFILGDVRIRDVRTTLSVRQGAVVQSLPLSVSALCLHRDTLREAEREREREREREMNGTSVRTLRDTSADKARRHQDHLVSESLMRVVSQHIEACALSIKSVAQERPSRDSDRPDRDLALDVLECLVTYLPVLLETTPAAATLALSPHLVLDTGIKPVLPYVQSMHQGTGDMADGEDREGETEGQ
ncbi:hypothetical protein KIPB_007323, partial [Kipferlia bialata]|eukprot:g7323.t1